MRFIQPCFIRKNTTEIKNKLKELGYHHNPLDDDDREWIAANHGMFISVDEGFQNLPLDDIDCGTNEELFLALAALRDDTDKWQLFVFDGIDVPDYFLQKGDMWICSLDKHLVENCHKATVEEIITYFNRY